VVGMGADTDLRQLGRSHREVRLPEWAFDAEEPDHFAGRHAAGAADPAADVRLRREVAVTPKHDVGATARRLPGDALDGGDRGPSYARGRCSRSGGRTAWRGRGGSRPTGAH